MNRNRHWIFVMIATLMVLSAGCSGIHELYVREVAELDREIGTRAPETVQASELAGLPENVRIYLSNSGVIGHERVYRAKLNYKGFMKTSRDGKWVPAECEQVNSPDLQTRIWYGKLEFGPGIFVEGRHIWKRGYGEMLIKLGPFTLIDLKGEKVSQSDLMTWFNDMLFQPTAFLQTNINWVAEGKYAARGEVSAGGYSGSALFLFNEKYEVTNFITHDRYMLDGTNIVLSEWQTPLRNIKQMAGFTLPTEGEAQWKETNGTWVYFRILSEGMKLSINGKTNG